MKKIIVDKIFYILAIAILAFGTFVFTLADKVAALEKENAISSVQLSFIARDVSAIKCFLNDKFEGCKK